MCDAMVGVLAGVVLMAYVLLGWQACKTLWAREYGRGAVVLSLMVLPALVATYPAVLGLLVLLALCVGGFLLLVKEGSEGFQRGGFFGCWQGWACFDLAGDCLKLAALVLLALVQAVTDGKG